MESNRALVSGIFIALGVVVIVGTSWARFSKEPDTFLPPLPARPKAAAANLQNLPSTDYRPEAYEAYVTNDGSRFGSEKITVANLGLPLPYLSENVGQTMKPGASIQTKKIRLSLRVEKLESDTGRGSFSTEHLVLRIQNETNRHLAYRVVTHPSGGKSCSSKGDLRHNAIAIPPKGAIERTECLYRKGMTVDVERVETIDIPELSYFYISRLIHRDLGLDPVANRGHAPPGTQTCEHTNAQAIQRGFERGITTWRDVVDFYARHRCETYLFPAGYKAITAIGQYKLPVDESQISAK